MSSHFFAFNTIKAASSANEDPFYPASNILERPTYKEFRSTTTTAVIVFDLWSVTAIDSLLLCGNNAAGSLQATSLLLEGSMTNAWTTPPYSISYDLTFDDQQSNLVYLQLPTKSFRYWRLTLQNPGGAYAGISNCFLGLKTCLSVDIGYKFSKVGPSIVNKGRYGQRFIDKLPDLRMFECSMSVMNQTESDQLSAIIDGCGTHTPIWMILSPGLSSREAGYFYFADTMPIENLAYQLYNASFTLEEVV